SCQLGPSLSIPRPLSYTRFPYTTLFRSEIGEQLRRILMRVHNDARRSFGRFVQTRGVRRSDFDPHADLAGRRASAQSGQSFAARSEEHTSELQSRVDLVCRLLLEKKTKR